MKKSRNKKVRILIVLLPIVVIVVLIWFLTVLFEGKKPEVHLQPLPEYLSEPVDFTLIVADKGMGLRNLEISLKQAGNTIPIIKKEFKCKGIFNKDGTHSFKGDFNLDPEGLNLIQGQVELVVEVHDFSKRRGGDGNPELVEHKMIVDMIPPSITALSKNHNISTGGSGLIIYRTSADSVESGVLVNELFFPGVPMSKNNDGTGINLCYFALPWNSTKDTHLYLRAKDSAGNEAKKGFPHYIKVKRFHKDKIGLSEGLLDIMISSFSPDLFGSVSNKVDKYLLLNNNLREKNYLVIKDLCKSPSKKRLWEGAWSRMKNAATMANFGDQRHYYYNGKLIDKGVHLGVDLASLANAPIGASNSGKVVYAADLGIYGLTVVIDHGQGLYTMYGHLSRIDVKKDQFLNKGDIIGATGETGLATGDHLHFSFIVNGVFVNPIEWWDEHWIKHNIYRKLSQIERVTGD